tara:strand:+ start:70 stop:486 length:417 start_codon:yes stop_codon:yes gene_type:complete
MENMDMENTDMKNECVICLEKLTKKNDNFKCDNCKNSFHKECIYNLKYKICPLCRCKIKIEDTRDSQFKFTFNNMNENDVYNIDKYIERWGKKECIEGKHTFFLETLGNWEMNNRHLIFEYTCMHIECKDCKISTIMK